MHFKGGLAKNWHDSPKIWWRHLWIGPDIVRQKTTNNNQKSRKKWSNRLGTVPIIDQEDKDTQVDQNKDNHNDKPVYNTFDFDITIIFSFKYVSDDMENNMIPKMEDSSAKTWDGKCFYLYRTCEIIQNYGRVNIFICIEHVRSYKPVLISYLEKKNISLEAF